MTCVTIFEGPDASGKSTTIARLYPNPATARVDHHGPYLGEADVAHRYFTSLTRETTREDIVLDRSWLSEPIYGVVMRNGADRVGRARARILGRVAATRGGVVALCLPPIGKLLKTWRARADREYLDRAAKLAAVYDRYAELATRASVDGLPLVVYDCRRSASLEGLRDALERVRRRPPLGAPGGGVWRPGVSVLIVSGRPGGGQTAPSEANRTPFSGLHRGGCSIWLADRLEAAGVPEDALYWANAADAAGRETDPSFVGALSPRKVIALGENAAAWCLRAGVTAAEVPHPQYWRRFRRHEPYPLIEELLK